MALVLGTNSGFVASAPAADPGGIALGVDNSAVVTKDQSPGTANTITQVGWWCDNATEESNFEIGLYADSSGAAGSLLFSTSTNAKGTGSGWKTASVNWSISPSTNYWLGLQLDDTATQTKCDIAVAGGSGIDGIGGPTTLPDPYGGGALDLATGMYAIYAVWEAGTPPTSPVASCKNQSLVL